MVNKTAIQWLYEQYRKEAIPTDAITELFREAERMEKEQIISAHKTANLEAGFEYSADYCANQYYNQTFKSE